MSLGMICIPGRRNQPLAGLANISVVLASPEVLLLSFRQAHNLFMTLILQIKRRKKGERFIPPICPANGGTQRLPAWFCFIIVNSGTEMKNEGGQLQPGLDIGGGTC